MVSQLPPRGETCMSSYHSVAVCCPFPLQSPWRKLLFSCVSYRSVSIISLSVMAIVRSASIRQYRPMLEFKYLVAYLIPN